MIATLPYVQQKVDEFNKLIFKNQLEPIPIHIGSSRTRLGSISCKHRKTAKGIEFYGFKLTISKCFDLQERDMEDTIIHELIHYYILSKQLHDSSPHGTLFKQLMNHINQHFGRNITISHRSSSEERSADKRIKEHFVCITELEDGRTGITVSAKTRIFEMWRYLPRFFKLKKMTWYWTTNPFFNQFSNAIRPKIYLYDSNKLEEELKDAKELECDGTTFRVKKH